MDVPYLIHVPDGDELWLVDGEQRLLITPRIYDLLASNGADLPPAYGIEELREQNAKLLESLRSIQPTDSEGNVLEVADTVHMLRSEYDGDHEWDDVVVELALTKWGGDRWIVRGSKGEAWACECTRTGHDDDAYESSSDVEPLDDATLIEVENAKLRNLVHILCHCMQIHTECDDCRLNGSKGELAFDPLLACEGLHELLREVGIEVES